MDDISTAYQDLDEDAYDFEVIRTDLESFQRLGRTLGYPNVVPLVDNSLMRLRRLQDKMKWLEHRSG